LVSNGSPFGLIAVSTVSFGSYLGLLWSLLGLAICDLKETGLELVGNEWSHLELIFVIKFPVSAQTSCLFIFVIKSDY
jgi:hypothetical protein